MTATMTRVRAGSITARGVGFRHGDHPWLFRDANLHVGRGITAVLGPNGTGKTTLLKCLAGLLTPVEGDIVTTGQIGYVPQSAGGSFPYLAHEMVLMGRARMVSTFSMPRHADHVAAADALERVGLLHFAQRPFNQLSGGEQQLVLIARALAGECNTLILDEPVSALDLRNQAVVLGLLGELAEQGVGIIFSTHHPEHALFLGGYACAIEGQTVRYGAVAEMVTSTSLSRLYGINVVCAQVEVCDATLTAVVPRYASVKDL